MSWGSLHTTHEQETARMRLAEAFFLPHAQTTDIQWHWTYYLSGNETDAKSGVILKTAVVNERFLKSYHKDQVHRTSSAELCLAAAQKPQTVQEGGDHVESFVSVNFAKARS
ncbi:hypothetical protein NDU88_002470 [Pleurodeles waltl]|uniref:Uncharacterized protein n=1 Tax=Pleurodeles waltl TaxID=8319 RepID=A0AAV7WNN5_PLEWA|nr:hypothetical protein NDU88_002470 [Pleurodeles waltl]